MWCLRRDQVEIYDEYKFIISCVLSGEYYMWDLRRDQIEAVHDEYQLAIVSSVGNIIFGGLSRRDQIGIPHRFSLGCQ
jgi:hypothetical protein